MPDPLFFEDRDGASSSESDSATEALASPVVAVTAAKPAWHDPDDASAASVPLLSQKRTRKLRRSQAENEVPQAEYAARLRAFHSSRTRPSAAWAQLPSEKRQRRTAAAAAAAAAVADGGLRDGEGMEDEEEEEENEDEDGGESDVERLQRTTSGWRGHAGGLRPLREGVLAIRQVRNANQEDPSAGEARCVEFHPSGRLLLTAGLDKTLRIFQVDGERNAKVQGVHFRKFPIYSAKFTGGGTQVVLTGRRRFFQQVDVETGTVSTVQTLGTHAERAWERVETSADGRMLGFVGERGKVVLVENGAKREVGEIRVNGRVGGLQWGKGNEVYVTSVEGVVYLWDVRKMGCVDRHRDEGVVHSTCIGAGEGYYATGSDSGVVNLYKSAALGAGRVAGTYGMRGEKPAKSFFNLTTRIDEVEFNCDGRLMAFWSHEKKNALRVVHVPSMTVYRNWPVAKATVRRPCAVRFSPTSGFLAVGNDRGDVHLMRLASYVAG